MDLFPGSFSLWMMALGLELRIPQSCTCTQSSVQALTLGISPRGLRTVISGRSCCTCHNGMPVPRGALVEGLGKEGLLAGHCALSQQWNRGTWFWCPETFPSLFQALPSPPYPTAIVSLRLARKHPKKGCLAKFLNVGVFLVASCPNPRPHCP